MKEEIAAAVFFLTRLAKRYGSLGNEGREYFAAALTSVLFETYKNHWDPSIPSRGQAYRCLRMNRLQIRDPVLELACERSTVRYEDLGLPWELTVWVDPGEVSCRYGERSAPFCVSLVDAGRLRDGWMFSRRIQYAVERAGLDVKSEESSDEDEDADTTISSSSSSQLAPCPASDPPPNPEPKTIPTVSNPNSVYQIGDFAPAVSQTWQSHPKRKGLAGDGFASHNLQSGGPQGCQKVFKPYRHTLSFSGPRVDRYHWVSKTRS